MFSLWILESYMNLQSWNQNKYGAPSIQSGRSRGMELCSRRPQQYVNEIHRESLNHTKSEITSISYTSLLMMLETFINENFYDMKFLRYKFPGFFFFILTPTHLNGISALTNSYFSFVDPQFVCTNMHFFIFFVVVSVLKPLYSL